MQGKQPATTLHVDDLRLHVDHELACVAVYGGAVLLCVDCGVMIAETEVTPPPSAPSDAQIRAV